MTSKQFLFDANKPTGYAQVLEETRRNGAGMMTKQRMYTLGQDVITQSDTSLASGAPLFLLYDGHGSTRAVVDGVVETGDKYILLRANNRSCKCLNYSTLLKILNALPGVAIQN